MASLLASFLLTARSALLRSATPPVTFTVVLGNQSADLDSFICAVVYSYFYTQLSRRNGHGRLFVPLLNLPTTQSCELWRLRPEFATALRSAERRTAINQQNRSDDRHRDEDKKTLEQLVTIADIRASAQAPLHLLFTDGPSSTSGPSEDKTQFVLVDHNALSIPTLSTDSLTKQIEITGCIDHHIDEDFVPRDASPRIVWTGIGSCMSLVVEHLRHSQLWQSDNDGDSDVEVAKLALAPILIDTANLTAKDKVSDTDREAVAFLESRIASQLASAESTSLTWDRESFYNGIAASKANSLDLLTFSEIFGRDYKEWTESTSSSEKLNIGISSVVKPINWLLRKSGSSEAFWYEMHKFAQESDHALSLFGIMTTSKSDDGDFQRELLIVAFGSTAAKALDTFKSKATAELRLEQWKESSDLLEKLAKYSKQEIGLAYVWWQRDVGKSRKQVAPLLRETAQNSLDP